MGYEIQGIPLEQKLQILSASEDIGIVEAFHKYSASTSASYSWKQKYKYKGEMGLKVTHDTV